MIGHTPSRHPPIDILPTGNPTSASGRERGTSKRRWTGRYRPCGNGKPIEDPIFTAKQDKLR